MGFRVDQSGSLWGYKKGIGCSAGPGAQPGITQHSSGNYSIHAPAEFFWPMRIITCQPGM